MKYRIVRLGRDYSGKIENFAEARNSFLSPDHYVLFLDDDEEASDMLLEHITKVEARYPYYWIRRINLWNGRYRAIWNPEYAPRLVSYKVRFVGRVHETIVPKKPHGMIDFPIIHNHIGPSHYRNYWYQNHAFYRLWLGTKKVMEVLRDR